MAGPALLIATLASSGALWTAAVAGAGSIAVLTAAPGCSTDRKEVRQETRTEGRVEERQAERRDWD